MGASWNAGGEGWRSASRSKAMRLPVSPIPPFMQGRLAWALRFSLRREVSYPDRGQFWQSVGACCDGGEFWGVGGEPRTLRSPLGHGGDEDVDGGEPVAEEPWPGGLGFQDAPQPLRIGVRTGAQGGAGVLAVDEPAWVVAIGESRVNIGDHENQPAQKSRALGRCS